MNARRITMLDVAKGAGVHVTTVSLALRNHPRIPINTRNELRKLATEMGYRPDPLLQTLIAYRSRTFLRRNPPTLAYVTNWDSRFGWKHVTAHPQFFLGAQSRAMELGYNLEHFWLGEQSLHPKRLSQILRARAINGLIVASHLPDLPSTSEFEWQFFSAVKIDHVPHRPALHNVTNDQLGIIRLAVKRVIAAGYKRIGFVMHRGWNDSANRLWSAGFQSAQSTLPEAARLPMMLFPATEPDAVSTSKRDFNPVANPAEFAHWFKQHRPDVILSKSSFIRPCLDELGLRAPGGVAFVDLFLEDAVTLAKYDKNHNGKIDPEEVAAMEADEKEAVQLSPFEVRTDKDRGYQAANAGTGGRVDLEYKMAPAALSAMTKEFLEDWDITDVRQSFKYAMNVDRANNSNDNASPFGDFQYNFRGVGDAGN